MMNETLWWMLIIPFVMSGVTMFVLPKFANFSLKHTCIAAGLGVLISTIIIAAAFSLGKGSKTSDVELWNGQITGKTRVHDSYVQSYPCNCRQQCSGSGQNQTCSTVCDTCYEDHYTVTWEAQSNIGNYRIDHKDSTSKRVYKSEDSRFYTKIQVGEACAREHSYTNYIKAVPESLFRPAANTLKAQFAAMIPNYPISIYNFWYVDRVIPVKVKVPNLFEWNRKLSDSLKYLGPLKQANAVIVLVNSADPNYAYALQDAWINGKKNDIIIIIGTTKFPAKADWVRVLALTDQEIFKIKLRDDLMDLETLTADGVISALTTNTKTYYVRKSMKDFAYLDAEIDPPTWVNVSTGIAIFLAYLGFLFWSVSQDGNRKFYHRPF